MKFGMVDFFWGGEGVQSEHLEKTILVFCAEKRTSYECNPYCITMMPALEL